jgi:hypothetical protein
MPNQHTIDLFKKMRDEYDEARKKGNEINKRYYQRNKEKINEKRRINYENNKDELNAKRRQRRADKKSLQL